MGDHDDQGAAGALRQLNRDLDRNRDRLRPPSRCVATGAASSWRVPRFVAIGVGFVSLFGCSEEPRPKNLILFTVDTLRADATGAKRSDASEPSTTPLFDQWAAEGVVFERCFAPRGQTHPSLASILTGKYPASHGLRRNGQPLAPIHEPLPVLLKRRGYRTAAFCASLDRTRFDFWIRGFDVALDGTGGSFIDEAKRPDGQRGWDESVTQAAIRYLESLPKDDAPLFLWVHLFDAHEPYTPDIVDAREYVDPDYRGTLVDDGLPGESVARRLRAFTLGTTSLDAADREYIDGLYRASIRGCDRRLSRIVDALNNTGRLADSIRVYTADHGEDLGEHARYYGHGNSIYDTSLHVPLVIAGGDGFRAGARVSDLVQSFDVFETLLAGSGATPPSDSESLDLSPLARGDVGARGREFVIGEWEDRLHSISDGTWKLIHNPQGVQPNNPPFEAIAGIGFPYRCRELYNVATDPLEATDLYRRGHPEAVRLFAELERFLGDPKHRGSGAGGSSESDIEALRALGYVGSNDRDLPRIDCEEDHR